MVQRARGDRRAGRITLSPPPVTQPTPVRVVHLLSLFSWDDGRLAWDTGRAYYPSTQGPRSDEDSGEACEDEVVSCDCYQ